MKTLDDYFANKKSTNFKKEARKPEELKKPNLEKKADEKTKTSTIVSHLNANDLYNSAVGKTETTGLLGF